jgi:hypothetical protein
MSESDTVRIALIVGSTRPNRFGHPPGGSSMGPPAIPISRSKRLTSANGRYHSSKSRCLRPLGSVFSIPWRALATQAR